MAQAPYIVPARGFGRIYAVPVQGLSPEAYIYAQEIGHRSGDGLELPLTVAETHEGNLSLSHHKRPMGTVSTEDSQHYEPFYWLLDAGITPQVTAYLDLQADNRDTALSLLLPAPELIVPANEPPAQRWAMIDGTTPIELELNSRWDNYPAQPAQVLVQLAVRRVLGRRTVGVLLGETLVATMPSQQANRLLKTLEDYHHTGILAIARAYYDPTPRGHTLTVYADPLSGDRGITALAATALAGSSLAITAAAAARAKATAAPALSLPGSSFSTAAVIGSTITATQASVAIGTATVALAGIGGITSAVLNNASTTDSAAGAPAAAVSNTISHRDSAPPATGAPSSTGTIDSEADPLDSSAEPTPAGDSAQLPPAQAQGSAAPLPRTGAPARPPAQRGTAAPTTPGAPNRAPAPPTLDTTDSDFPVTPGTAHHPGTAQVSSPRPTGAVPATAPQAQPAPVAPPATSGHPTTPGPTVTPSPTTTSPSPTPAPTTRPGTNTIVITLPENPPVPGMPNPPMSTITLTYTPHPN